MRLQRPSASLGLWILVVMALVPDADAQTPRQTAPVGDAAASDSAESMAAEPTAPVWCAPETEPLAEGVCFAPGPVASEVRMAEDASEHRRQPRVLVIFLHSLVGKGTNWQWEQQRLFVRVAKQHAVSVLMPRGMLGIGPGRAQDVWAWPTASAMQAEHERPIIDGWLTQKRALEERDGSFDRTYVFGFSNGAYYASSLALRGALDVEGYGIFAGGSGSKYQRLLAQRTERRAPIFVGYGTKDPARAGQRALIDLLKALDWRHAQMAANVGHTVMQEQLDRALAFLSQPAGD